MHDQYIQRLDDEIDSCKRYIEDYRCDIHTLFRLVSLMDEKMTYICKYPKRAESHYNPNTDATRSLIKLEDCEMSVRLENCLLNAGFTYLEDVLFCIKEHGETKLLKLKNFGRRSLNEIKDILKEHSLL